MKVVKVKISKDKNNYITVRDGYEMNRAFIETFNLPINGGEIKATMKIYKKGKIVIEK